MVQVLILIGYYLSACFDKNWFSGIKAGSPRKTFLFYQTSLVCSVGKLAGVGSVAMTGDR